MMNKYIFLLMFLSISPFIFGVEIQISSLNDLVKIGVEPEYPLDAEYILLSDIDAVSTENMDGGLGFKPIGNQENPFTGKFNGNGKTINGLFIKRESDPDLGLFGYIQGGEVRNLILENAFISGYVYAGGISGENEGGKIINCWLKNCAIQVVGACGGVGGIVANHNNGGVIERCLVSGSMINDAFEHLNLYGIGVGGLTSINNGLVKDSYVYDSSLFGIYFVGGLIGINDRGIITNCYNNSYVRGLAFSGGAVGYTNNGKGNNIFWDMETSRTTVSALGTGKYTNDMKKKNTYTGWDFNNVWDIVDGSSYPFLRWVGNISNPGEEAYLPFITGNTIDEARNKLYERGFYNIKIFWKCSDNYAKDVVITQSPIAYSKVNKNSVIQLFVSTGKCFIIMPEVVGNKKENVFKFFNNMGLKVQFIEECDNYIPKDVVLRQSELPGTPITTDTVTFWVSSGLCEQVQYLRVPNVIGLDKESARVEIINQGFYEDNIFIYEQYNDISPNGTVIAQSPVGGSQVLNTTTVILTVSKGPDPNIKKISTPKGLKAYSGKGFIYLIWDANLEYNLGGYILERRMGGTGAWVEVNQQLIKQTSYRDVVNTSDNSDYYYRIYAQDTEGNRSEPSEPVLVEQGKVKIRIPKTSWSIRYDGETIRIPIIIEGTNQISIDSVDMDIQFDDSFLEPMGVETSVIVKNLLTLPPNLKSATNIIKVTSCKTYDNKGDPSIFYSQGRLYDVLFSVKKTGLIGQCYVTPEVKVLSASLEDANAVDLPVTIQNDGLTLINYDLANTGDCNINEYCLFGDIDGDAKVTGGDINLLLRKVVRKTDIQDLNCDLSRGDLNGDGILDCADASLLMRFLSGLSLNPGKDNAPKQYSKNIVVDIESEGPVNEKSNDALYKVYIRLSTLKGFAGMELAMIFDNSLLFHGLNLEDYTVDFQKNMESGLGYLKVSISNGQVLTKDSQERVMEVIFKVPQQNNTDTLVTYPIFLRDVRLKGQYGDDLSWYTNVTTKDGSINITPPIKLLAGSTWDESSVWLTSAGYNPIRVDEYSLEIEKDKVIRTEPPEGSVLNVGAEVKVFVSAGATLEMFTTVLVNNFATLDINGDSYVDWEEAKSKYPGLTQEVFNQVDTNSDGNISKSEAGIAGQEGEGSIQPKEDEGSTETPTETKQGCGCSGCGKSMDSDNIWWKYILDVILFGMLIVFMSSMHRLR
ncbi:MAG: PASTA domain-containing protein [Candidatus Hydrogenedens sp.]|nr:PASTA domain-containing protein [Candidatus Hydrogenedens sp.]